MPTAALCRCSIWHDVLFGVNADRLDLLKTQIGLSTTRLQDIENPWLLTFLGLGLLGWPLLLGSLFTLMLHLGRRANTGASWMLVTVVLLICSTSNSLGRKTPDLVFLSIFAIALSSFKARQEQAPSGSARSYISECSGLFLGGTQLRPHQRPGEKFSPRRRRPHSCGRWPRRSAGRPARAADSTSSGRRSAPAPGPPAPR